MSRQKNEEGSSSGKDVAGKKIRDCIPGHEFVFVTPNGKQVGKAKNIIEFIRQVKSVPLQSVLYHANGKHFTLWLEAIGEKAAAGRISRIRGNDENVRLQIIKSV
jgi:hypothetical protein